MDKYKVTSEAWSIKLNPENDRSGWYYRKQYAYVVRYEHMIKQYQRVAYFTADGEMGGFDIPSSARNHYELVAPLPIDSNILKRAILRYMSSHK